MCQSIKATFFKGEKELIRTLVKAVLKYPLGLVNFAYTRNYYSEGLKSLGWKENDIGDENILVIAPHVDDETIGMGGTLLKYRKKAGQKSLVYVADGSGSVTDMTKEELVEARKDEARRIQDIYGIDDLYFLEQPDGQVDSRDEKVIERLYEIIKKENPDRIFMPYLFDGHIDHIESTRLTMKAIKKWNKNFNDIWMYEVNTLNDLRLINRVNTLDRDIFAQKKEIYKVFESQGVMGFDAFMLADRKKRLILNQGYAAETFIKMKLRTAFEIDEILREKGFEPDQIRQLSSQHNMMLSFLKNKGLKRKYNNNMNYILKAKYLEEEDEYDKKLEG